MTGRCVCAYRVGSGSDLVGTKACRNWSPIALPAERSDVAAPAAQCSAGFWLMALSAGSGSWLCQQVLVHGFVSRFWFLALTNAVASRSCTKTPVDRF